MAQVGGCWYLLVTLWKALVFENISKFNYGVQLIENLFYYKVTRGLSKKEKLLVEEEQEFLDKMCPTH